MCIVYTDTGAMPNCADLVDLADLAMPITYLTKLSSPKRTPQSNLHLGCLLAGIAGALNAGGFLAVGRYTSHMTGIVSEAADNIILGQLWVVLAAICMLLAFISGSATTAILINYARRNQFRLIFTPVFWVEASLLLVFGLTGRQLHNHSLITVSLTTVLLCYVMGLQNALITKISHAEIRTTHITGLVTDIGIELGKMLYWNKNNHYSMQKVASNRSKLVLHSSLVLAFFSGGLVGALGFKYLGFLTALPLAMLLLLISLAPYLQTRE